MKLKLPIVVFLLLYGCKFQPQLPPLFDPSASPEQRLVSAATTYTNIVNDLTRLRLSGAMSDEQYKAIRPKIVAGYEALSNAKLYLELGQSEDFNTQIDVVGNLVKELLARKLAAENK